MFFLSCHAKLDIEHKRIFADSIASTGNTLESDLKKLFEDTVANLAEHKLDHVVFTAGDPLAIMPLSELTMEKILVAGQLRFFAPLLIAKFIPSFLENSSKSSYTITSGGIAEHPQPNWSVIGAYAGGHHSMTRNLALDLKPIRVNCVQPGAVDTELWKMSEEDKKGFMDIVSKKMATGKVGRPEEVAQSFLAVLMDSNMDATVVRTDGGGLIM